MRNSSGLRAAPAKHLAIPDRGFKPRSPRDRTRAHCVGQNGSIIAPVYADEFASRTNGAKIALIR
jgi:hypothetical protein